MSGFLTTGLSALLANRTALDVTSNNIANVNTEGYSRRRAEFSERPGSFGTATRIGSGVEAATVRRIYDSFLSASVDSATSRVGRFSVLSDMGNRINNFLADPAVGLSPALNTFFGALEDAAGDPGSRQLRELALGEARSLADRFNGLSGEIAQLDEEIDRRLAGTVDEINDLAAEIAGLNLEIRTRGRGLDAPNDLLDRRALAVRTLAEKVGINAIETAEGDVNVVVEPGVSLVAGAEAGRFVAVADPFDGSRLALALDSDNGPSAPGLIVEGGELGALLTARRDLVDRSQAELGLTAAALALSFNDQQGRGLDLNAATGQPLFELAEPLALASTRNGGTATVAAAITDLGALQPLNYEIRSTGGGLSVTNVTDGTPVSFTGAGTALDPLVFDGLEVVLTGTVNDGDEFLVAPTARAAENLNVALTSGDELAFALPVIASGAASNSGSAVIDVTTVTDPTNPALDNDAVIEFLDPTTYQVDGAGAFAYTSGDPIVVNGVEFVISGNPSTGDRFDITATSGVSGDNRNAVMLTGLRSTGTLEGGTLGLSESFGRFVAASGAAARNYASSLEAQTALLEGATAAEQSVSGVDLDEEAANLLRFQQAYQAAAQVVSIGNSLFQDLLGALR